MLPGGVLSNEDVAFEIFELMKRDSLSFGEVIRERLTEDPITSDQSEDEGTTWKLVTSSKVSRKSKIALKVLEEPKSPERVDEAPPEKTLTGFIQFLLGGSEAEDGNQHSETLPSPKRVSIQVDSQDQQLKQRGSKSYADRRKSVYVDALEDPQPIPEPPPEKTITAFFQFMIWGE